MAEVVEEKSQDEVRKDAKNEVNRCVKHLISITETLVSLLDDEEKQERLIKTIDGLEASIKDQITILYKKPKRKPNENNRHNLTKPCLVTPAFSAYVKELRDTGKLGKLEGRAKAAVSSIIVDKCSSLLVNTLLISCDNYNIKDRKATFIVTPTMKKHLSTVITTVTKEREELHKTDESKALFDQDNYPSAMNNVIASHVRAGEYKGNHDDASTDLAALQAYLKTHNASLRAAK